MSTLINNKKNNYIGSINQMEFKGLLFEHNIKEILTKKLSNIYFKILTNVVIYDFSNDRITEIDLILITTSGIYVIEGKNWTGIIYGKINDRYWTKFYGKNIKSYKQINPILQNDNHIKFLMKYLNLNQGKFKSYIVFSNDTNIDRLDALKNNNSYLKILKIDELVNQVMNDLINSNIILMHEEIDKIYIKLKESNIDSIMDYIKNKKE